MIGLIWHGALTGLLAAAAIDYRAFKSWKSWDEAHAYQWSVALWRWTQGAIVGAVSSATLGAF